MTWGGFLAARDRLDLSSRREVLAMRDARFRDGEGYERASINAMLEWLSISEQRVLETAS